MAGRYGRKAVGLAKGWRRIENIQREFKKMGWHFCECGYACKDHRGLVLHKAKCHKR